MSIKRQYVLYDYEFYTTIQEVTFGVTIKSVLIEEPDSLWFSWARINYRARQEDGEAYRAEDLFQVEPVTLYVMGVDGDSMQADFACLKNLKKELRDRRARILFNNGDPFLVLDW
jgi:hypothetical protein